MLGKRKREIAVAPRRPPRSHEEPPLETFSTVDHKIFRTHFESMFEPLPESQMTTPSLDEDEEEAELSSEKSQWEGLSESESESEHKDATVKIVEHRAEVGGSEDAELERQQNKTFMVSACD